VVAVAHAAEQVEKGSRIHPRLAPSTFAGYQL
jgi:hypothetical protein